MECNTNLSCDYLNCSTHNNTWAKTTPVLWRSVTCKEIRVGIVQYSIHIYGSDIYYADRGWQASGKFLRLGCTVTNVLLCAPPYPTAASLTRLWSACSCLFVCSLMPLPGPCFSSLNSLVEQNNFLCCYLMVLLHSRKIFGRVTIAEPTAVALIEPAIFALLPSTLLYATNVSPPASPNLI